ncbi:MAG: YdiU family protein [Snowella sp.]|nr:YdiU family protein [Snowella sp.]
MSNNLPNPFLSLPYEPAIESLGNEYFDVVEAAQFPQHLLRFRNDALLPKLGLDPQVVTDDQFIEAFGQFQGVRPFLSLRYHGYQFGTYNPFLGDGRGFLYGQVWGTDGQLYDFGTKGSGRTPYSRTADGRLTLKGGVREVLAAEALHSLGVNTSRCLSLVETGEALWRGDEPSPTRSSVMIRFSRSHIRFGTFERLHYIKRADLIAPLLDHVIGLYYPEVPADSSDRYSLFYRELVKRVASLAAQWMAAGFCHGVLNTDNMSITGESFDYGPYAFIPTYDPRFTAAYFDNGGRYCYENQPLICRLNLELLQLPLAMVIPASALTSALEDFEVLYHHAYQAKMLQKLGLPSSGIANAKALIVQTIQVLQDSQVGYHQFFRDLAENFNLGWREDGTTILENSVLEKADWPAWQNLYHLALSSLPMDEFIQVGDRLKDANPKTTLLRPVIEDVWAAIANENNWKPFDELIQQLQTAPN